MCAGEPPGLTSVPTHFFKVILADCPSAASPTPESTVLGAFVMPNAAIDPETPLTAFTVPLQKLEAASGTEGALKHAWGTTQALFRAG